MIRKRKKERMKERKKKISKNERDRTEKER